MDFNLINIQQKALQYNRYLNGDLELYDKVNNLSQEEITKLKKKYLPSSASSRIGPVNLLRYLLVCAVENREKITPEYIERLKGNLWEKELDKIKWISDDIKQLFENYPKKTKSFFSNWKNAGSILFPFVYTDDIRHKTRIFLNNLISRIKKDCAINNAESHIVDFLGTRKQGSGSIWGSIYSKKSKNHKKAHQLHFYISHNGIVGGIYSGSNMDDSLRVRKMKPVASIDELVHLFKDIKKEWEDLLNTEINSPKKEFKQLEEYKTPLNQIFYGPPGTGKTYHTINEAIKIVDELSDEQFEAEYGNDRKALKDRFKEYVEKDQIAFVTFHQSMSYEDFIEGIRPETIEHEDGTKQISYEVKNGIFKEICENASTYQSFSEEPKNVYDFFDGGLKNKKIYKVSLGNTQDESGEIVYNYCKTNGYIAIGWGEDVDYSGVKFRKDIVEKYQNAGYSLSKMDFNISAIERLAIWMKEGDIVFVSHGTKLLKAVGVIEGDYEYKPNRLDGYNHYRKVKWLHSNDLKVPVQEIYQSNFSQQSIYQMYDHKLKTSFFTSKKKVEVKKKHVLIIDEINRGNVSQVFGELITLLEEDKRLLNKEQLEITLPYSQESFGVPNNLYVIGTMNTADRSVEALDTALRRRFFFKEMLPNPELISPANVLFEKCTNLNLDKEENKATIKTLSDFIGLEGDAIQIYESNYKPDEEEEMDNPFDSDGVSFNGIDLQRILDTINYRIEKLLDREHTIGHAYFMEVYNAVDPLTKLKQVFHKNIIPLLQEYFYGDYSKIGMVLGAPFIRLKKDEKNKPMSFAASFKDIDQDVLQDYKDRRVYELTPLDTWERGDFIKICE